MLFDRSHFESRHSSWTVLNGPEPRRLGPDRPQTSLEAKDINDADVAAEAEAGRSREKPGEAVLPCCDFSIFYTRKVRASKSSNVYIVYALMDLMDLMDLMEMAYESSVTPVLSEGS
jgi:hypothetical protein